MSMGTPGRDPLGPGHVLLDGWWWSQRWPGSWFDYRKRRDPKDRAVTPSDIHSTIYHVLGVDQTVQFLNHTGRPVPALDHGEVIHELV